ncbi:MAG: ATP-binding cassette domain-containing protein [Synergistaceae bacterium]|jgi:iron complex transport system ATP-binding protein|nr:ATP-binding cassette domain-containing protein [Synergistaceae bacterium]
MLEVKDLRQTYGRRGPEVLRGIDMTVREGAVTALIGANGAGKSTLVGVMSNLIPPSSGHVLLDGVELGGIDRRDAAKKIAVLKQTHHISIRVTVNDLVEFGRFPHCAGRLSETDRAKAEEAMEYMRVADLRGRYIDQLSGGQRQRAFIAMILAQDTHYVFFDEPLSSLDIKYSAEMMRIIKKLAAELGKSVIVVLHDLNFAAAFADHIAAMKDGRIVREGPPREMISKEVLDYVFDHDFRIISDGGSPVCMYT